MPQTRTYRRVELRGAGIADLVTARVCGPRPGAGWALIAPRAVGVCRSDLKELAGVRQGRRDFGHEMVAEVVDCADAGRLTVGDVVTLDPHVCVTRTPGFAELVEFHGPGASLQRALLPLSPGLAAGPGIFVEPLSCAARCVRRLEDALDTLGRGAGQVAVVGAGIFGVLIASLLRVGGAEVCLLNRSRGRLDWLASGRALPGAELLTFEEARGRRFDTLVLATTFAAPRLVTWCAEHAAAGALITLFGGTDQGMTTGIDEVDLDVLRRAEELREVRMGTRTCWLAGSHGAQQQDFRRAMAVLEQEPEVIQTAAALRGPTVSLAESPRALSRYARRPVYGKPVVQPTSRP